MTSGKTKRSHLVYRLHKGTCSLKKFDEQYKHAHSTILHTKVNTK